MKRLVDNCSKRLVVSFNVRFSTVDEIMKFLTCKCRTEEFFLDFRISGFDFRKSARGIGHRVPILQASNTKTTLRGIDRERNRL